MVGVDCGDGTVETREPCLAGEDMGVDDTHVTLSSGVFSMYSAFGYIDFC